MSECEFCSNYFLLPIFYGITFVSLCTRWYAFPLLYVYMLMLGAVEWIPLSLLESLIYTTFGLLAGVCVKYISHTTRILPKNILKHYHILLIYLFELLLAPFLFHHIDTIVPQTGFPVGVLMSMVFFVGWFILVYNINFRHENVLKQADVDMAFYNQTYLHWFYSLLPFYATSLLPVNAIVKIVIGLFLLCVLLFLEKHATSPLKGKQWPQHQL